MDANLRLLVALATDLQLMAAEDRLTTIIVLAITSVAALAAMVVSATVVALAAVLAAVVALVVVLAAVVALAAEDKHNPSYTL